MFVINAVVIAKREVRKVKRVFTSKKMVFCVVQVLLVVTLTSGANLS